MKQANGERLAEHHENNLEHRHPSIQVHHSAEGFTIMEQALPAVYGTTTRLSGFDVAFSKFGRRPK